MRADPGNYFQSADEAHEWLAFDDEGEEPEHYFYAYNDQYGEWELWRQAWLDKHVQLVVDSEVVTP